MNTTASNIIQTGNLTPAELKDSELVTLHLTIFTNHIKEKIPSLANRKIALAWYKSKINKDNIRNYYNQKISVFAYALLTDNLESIVKHQSF